MSTSARASSPTSVKPVPSRVYTYQGLDSDGRIRLSRQGQELRVVGIVYAASTPPAGVKKVVLVQVNASPNYRRDDKDKTYVVRSTSGESFRVVGQAQVTASVVAQPNSERMAVPAASMPGRKPEHQAEGLPSASAAELLEAPALISGKPSKAEVPRKKPAPTNEEVQRVARLRADGMDPTVRMAYVSFYIGESPANLYKKILRNEFPAPNKVGNGSFWLLSTLDAYKERRWKHMAV
jgi:predicted DNA-binding transcriptional regulator AlpA